MLYFKNVAEAVEIYSGTRYSDYLIVTRIDDPDGHVAFEAQVYGDGSESGKSEGELVEVMGKSIAVRARKLLPGQQIKVKANKTYATWIITRMN